MSSEEEAAAVAVEDICCASCGIAAVDDVKLMDCGGGCDIVKYCSEECQINHREQHEEMCKRYKDLFTPPEGSNWGECPICCLPLSIDASKSTRMSCCSKRICKGCNYANEKREIAAGLEHRCAFCREPRIKSQEEANKRIMNRVKKNDPDAMQQMAIRSFKKGDYENAFKYWTKAAELGDADAHYKLSVMYLKGERVEMDDEKFAYHSEEAAIRGHPGSRHNLGVREWENGMFERAKKHWIIAANLGYHDSPKMVMKLYTDGHASKEDYADALRSYQAAVEATKSPEREEAESL